MDKRKVFRYRNFPVYKKLRSLRKKLILLWSDFPQNSRRLVDQGKRAINSSCLNVAEGSNKPTDKEFAQFVNRSLTSLEEVMSVVELSFDDLLITEAQLRSLEAEIKEVAEDLLKFERSLRRK